MITKENQLAEIGREIGKCSICKRGKIGKPVPGEGNHNAKIVFIGEAPGQQEAKTGRPFVGRAGKLLRSLIKVIGLLEKEVYITNPVKYLPRRGTPNKADIIHGKIHLQKQLAIINPKLIILLGNVSQQAFFEKKIPIVKSHGSVVKEGQRQYFITIHPSAALRFKKFRKILESDFKKLKLLVKNV